MYNIKKSKYRTYTYKDWEQYLKQNDKKRLKLDFTSEPVLSAEVRKLIFPSIAAFCMGEHSDGKHLLSAADKFAVRTGETEYPVAMTWFVKEENYHSSYLAQYMNYHKEPLKKKNPLDFIFRRLRQVGGIFSEVSVLVTAEIIALSYYSALGAVARQIGSKALSDICAQMLHDELPHVIFQSYTLAHLPDTCGTRFFRIFFMEAVTIAVWMAYGELLKAGGCGFQHFLRENLGYLRQSFEISEEMEREKINL